jgi:hypothetical protein
LRQEAESKVNVRPELLISSRSIVAPSTADLHQLLALLISDKLTPEQRASLDTILYKSAVIFDSATPANAQTILSSGSIGDVRFRFSEPTAFAGHLPTHVNLTYRILGVTEVNGADALLLEPARIEP